MFAVHICIYNDGDFGFDETEFNIKGEEDKTFYFENRDDAVKALINSFHSLRNSLRPCGRENIETWIKFIDNNIEIICNNLITFKIYKCFGNQEITYELYEVEKIFNENGSYNYDEKEVEIAFGNFEIDSILLWESIKGKYLI